ncbi:MULTISPECIES: hypothetical protein [unclassified Sphingobium]|uniref:hypothetical protein n=1 Tax=unclassified Sphingobium TaxID=2611147 RepID=UPI002225B5BB|nr:MULTISPECIES: hypothetical protein [unclassified Sphingobium]MCW2410580.1 uncharacterized protein YfiM (DUF2279 family) [Sphingobium sp. B8D3D]MCW2413727.1 uncharacterized protein YfiM (DUF2279 family) [Sphingobium sp. B8D3A]
MQRKRASGSWMGLAGLSTGARIWRVLAILFVLFVLPVLIGAVLFTSGAPLADARATPTPLQVGAGRAAIEQLQASRQRPGGVSMLTLAPTHLDGLSALATHGFRPDRLNLYLHDERLHVAASHALPLGRWLNVGLVVSGPSNGFPEVEARIGAVSLPAYPTRLLLEGLRQLLRLRGAVIPPLDTVVQRFSIRNGAVMAAVQLPPKTGLLDQFTGGDEIDGAQVLDRYCALVGLQARDPQSDFAIQVRRAFPPGQAATAETNRAGFVALAMLVVDPRAGQLAGLELSATRRCPPPATAITLHGRDDLPKHWALSAALAAQTGVQFSSAMGEWKELADSLSAASAFQTGTASGFSFVDLAADRSGFQIAQAAGDPHRSQDVAQRLAAVTQERLLPPALLQNDEGLRDAAFAARYGSVEDPRYARLVAEIDRTLVRDGLLAQPD